MDGEQRLTADVREESKKTVRLINLAKGRYAKKPTEELKTQILNCGTARSSTRPIN